MTYSSMQLGAYLQRIGAAPAGTGLDTLLAVQRAHRLAVPFENLDIPLGRGIDIRPEQLFDKIVEQRRGGYCFEQNALFLGMLRALGFKARPLLARVWLMAESTPPRTHTLNLVELDGAQHIADAGFGGGYTPPMPLEADKVATSDDGVRHRLSLDPEHGWMLERDAGTGWAPQYSFTTEVVWPADLEAANHWTSTRPNTRFTTLRIVSRALPDGYASLVERTLTLSRGGEAEVSEIENAESYRSALASSFGLDLAPDEVGALGLF